MSDPGFRTSLAPAQDDSGPVPVLMDAPPAPPAHAGGLTDSQVIRIHALAAASRAKPQADPDHILRLADRFVNWIKYGGGE